MRLTLFLHISPRTFLQVFRKPTGCPEVLQVTCFPVQYSRNRTLSYYNRILTSSSSFIALRRDVFVCEWVSFPLEKIRRISLQIWSSFTERVIEGPPVKISRNSSPMYSPSSPDAALMKEFKCLSSLRQRKY